MSTQELTPAVKHEAAGEERTRPGRTYVPNVDICETADALELWADMPGVDEGSIEVKLEDNILSIEGQVGVKDYEGLRPLYTEYNVGNYARRFTVSSDIDAEHIRARIVNGVLELVLPKSARAKPRRIPISVQ